jgi:hypothetical protein
MTRKDQLEKKPLKQVNGGGFTSFTRDHGSWFEHSITGGAVSPYSAFKRPQWGRNATKGSDSGTEKGKAGEDTETELEFADIALTLSMNAWNN